MNIETLAEAFYGPYQLFLYQMEITENRDSIFEKIESHTYLGYFKAFIEPRYDMLVIDI